MNQEAAAVKTEEECFNPIFVNFKATDMLEPGSVRCPAPERVRCVLPAESVRSEATLTGAAGVRVQVDQTRVTLLALLYSRVTADVHRSLFETGRAPPETLHDRALTAVREELREPERLGLVRV